MKELTQEYLKERLHYCPDDGLFTWNPSSKLPNNWNARRQYTIAGHTCKVHGYVSILIDGVLYRAHRLAFLYMTGAWPKEQVDHINHNRSYNKWCNIRDVSRAENAINGAMYKNNTSGITGVSWDKKSRKWFASICINKKVTYLGRFELKADAIAIRKKVEIELGFHENHGLPIKDING